MNEESIFAAALEKPTPAEREAFLVEACGDDIALRQRLEILLLADGHGRGILERGPHDAFEQASHGPLEDPPIAEGPGDCIGPYKLKEKIGEGGFGLVFVAEQQQPIRRKVALKIIKPGMDTREVIARFEAERQALAMMDHPNIAKVLDAGATGVRSQESGVRKTGAVSSLTPDFCLLTPDVGRAYFVMELVRGLPITKYCDCEQNTTRERLELFIPLCHAVQHAHQKGIIHRDLKPSNVLVTSHDGKPVVKVIDFGVAKALNQQLTEHSVYTRFAQMIGTPAYMSPEQAEMSGLDVDTRSDVYSLGVLLYELLTGSTPFDRKRLATLGFDELRRIIREEEPEKPSTRLSHSQETLVSVAAQRKTEPARLTKLLRGELDWIVMKALEKDRTRRYESANDFARDVQRYLADEPVQACPPSMAYRTRKFFRRNKGPVLAAGLVLVALLAGIFGTTTGLIAAQRERDDAVFARQEEARQRQIAEHNEKQALAAAVAEKEAKAASEAREADTKAVVAFLERILFGKGGFVVAGTWENTTLRQAIERAAPTVQTEFANRPLVEARLRATLGWAFMFMREFKSAAIHLERSYALYAAHRGKDDPDTLLSMTNLARAYVFLNRNAEAAQLRERALTLQKGKLRADHPQILENMDNLAQIYFRLRRDSDAVAIIDECVRLGANQSQDPRMFVRLSRLLDLRLRHFEKAKDSSGCRATAEMHERLNNSDANTLHANARFRAVTAAVLRASDKSESPAKAADVEADRAMVWLKQAVAVGFNQVASIRDNPDFRDLRDRDDFKMLVANLAAREADGKK